MNRVAVSCVTGPPHFIGCVQESCGKQSKGERHFDHRTSTEKVPQVDHPDHSSARYANRFLSCLSNPDVCTVTGKHADRKNRLNLCL